jgi:Ni/Co efflux regulator RcnB
VFSGGSSWCCGASGDGGHGEWRCEVVQRTSVGGGTVRWRHGDSVGSQRREGKEVADWGVVEGNGYVSQFP